MLTEMPEVSELHPVPDAHVPVMKFKFCGVSIDLLYAKLSLPIIPEVCIYIPLLLQIKTLICIISNLCNHVYKRIGSTPVPAPPYEQWVVIS